MHKYSLLHILFILFYLSSCGDKSVDSALHMAGENIHELNKLLEYYRQDGDYKKEKAARFLIANMPAHYTKTSIAVDSFVNRMLNSDTLETKILYDWWKEYDCLDKTQLLADIELVNSDYLIDNIESAFNIYEITKWKSEINEDLFFNYILPYRVADEPLSPKGWRDSLYASYHSLIDTISDLKRAYYAVFKSLSSEMQVRHVGGMPYLMSVADASRIKRGRCLQQCIYIVSVMRALGIPAVVDGITRWANYSSVGHSWVSLVTSDGTYTVYGEDTIAKKYNPINSSSFSLKYRVKGDYPISLDFVKTVPKIWRTAYALNNVIYSDKNAPEVVRTGFEDVHSLDVSADYGYKGKYKIDVPKGTDCAYLCVYATGDDWIPVAFSTPDIFRKCTFSCLPESVVYLPVAYIDKRMVPFGTPFYINNNSICHIVPNYEDRETINLTRKYPFARSILRTWQEVEGACIVASNDFAFKYSDTIYKQRETPVYRNVVKIDSLKKYRYIKYVSNPKRRGAITELRLYSDDTMLSGKPFATDASNVVKCFDNNTTTYMSDLKPGYTVGVDLGSSIKVDSVVFYLRNDGNYIDIGDNYELLHYDKKWNSLAFKKADKEELVFSDIPQNALLLLKNQTKGKEERIFTYENGTQVWW